MAEYRRPAEEDVDIVAERTAARLAADDDVAANDYCAPLNDIDHF
jgi:hypothetical protein